MSNEEYKAYLRVRRFDTREVIHSVGLSDLTDRYVERVMSGMLHNMNTDEYFVDDTEVDAARKAVEKPREV